MSEASTAGAGRARRIVNRNLCRHDEALVDPAVRAETHVFVGYNRDRAGQRESSCYRCLNCTSTLSVALPGYNWDEPTPAVDVTATGPVADATLREETQARAGFVPAVEVVA